MISLPNVNRIVPISPRSSLAESSLSSSSMSSSDSSAGKDAGGGKNKNWKFINDDRNVRILPHQEHLAAVCAQNRQLLEEVRQLKLSQQLYDKKETDMKE